MTTPPLSRWLLWFWQNSGEWASGLLSPRDGGSGEGQWHGLQHHPALVPCRAGSARRLPGRWEKLAAAAALRSRSQARWRFWAGLPGTRQRIGGDRLQGGLCGEGPGAVHHGLVFPQQSQVLGTSFQWHGGHVWGFSGDLLLGGGSNPIFS